ncbi:DUF460 domain-containing protein [Candidatus Parvarchaeota archaeon]|nr:DUF460 domain-containing protein [Candidatus Parvarchaeota archaeon]
MAKYGIIGIDPGATCAVCAIDLSGKLIGCSSSLESGKDSISLLINGLAVPSIIATDKIPAPFAVKKVAAGFNAPVYCPDREMREAEKSQIVRGMEFENAHIRDAYCAALDAYRHFANKFRQIDAMGLDDAQLVKHLVVRGNTVFRAVILCSKDKKLAALGAMGFGEGKTSIVKNAAWAGQEEKRLAERLICEVEELSRTVANLKAANLGLQAENGMLKSELEKSRNGFRANLGRDAQIRKLTGALARLGEYVRRLKAAKNHRGRQVRETIITGKGNQKDAIKQPDLINFKWNDVSGKQGGKEGQDGQKKLQKPVKVDLNKLVSEYRDAREDF